MMKVVLFYVLLFIPVALHSQYVISEGTVTNNLLERKVLLDVSSHNNVDPLLLQFAVNNRQEPQAYGALLEDISDFIKTASDKRDKASSESKFLEQLYYKVHRKYLKRYSSYSSLNKMVATGEYDCLSGTILYSVILEKLGIPFTAYETDYHIFLIAHSETGDILFESTDALTGFVTSEEEISKRIDKFQSSEAVSGNLLKYSDRRMKKSVSLEALAGLQYFNASVAALENDQLVDAIDQLCKARIFYDTERLDRYGKYVARVVVNDLRMSQAEKQEYLLLLTRFLNEGVVFASR